MTLWIVLTVMSALVAVWAAIPFLRRGGAEEATVERTRSTAIYRDQLRQIDAELKAGSINEAEAQATRAETARRLVLAEREERTRAAPAQLGDRTFAAIGIAGAVALGSAVLYAKIGQPEKMPGMHAAGGVADGSMGAALPPRHPAVGRGQASGAADGQESGQGSRAPTVEGMIERLAQRLKSNPDDPDGWRTLGWSYASQGRFRDAIAAYDEAIKRQPENGDLYSARGEILVRSANGVVSPEAAGVFKEAIKRDRENPRARYFLGLRKAQAGDGKAALDDWIAILKGAPTGEPWVRDLSERVEQLAAELKIDVSGRLAAAPPSARFGGNGPGILGALQEQGRAGAQPPAGARASAPAPSAPSAGDAPRTPEAGGEDRSAMIRGMVDGLAARLEKQPRDFEGWSRLIRSRTVLGELDKAKAALARARQIFADTPEALASIGATAREIGLEP